MTKLSINPITGKGYEMPESGDRNGIEQFLVQNEGKTVVVVQGLGFVGAVMSIVCANALQEEYAVIGIDLLRKDTYWKIRGINTGDFPVVASDPKIDEYYKKAQEKGNLYATYDDYAYKVADVVIVDINLDVQKESNHNVDLVNFDVNLDGFRKAITSIGESCKEDALILVETTVPPGTCQTIVKPIIHGCFNKRGLSNSKLRIGHSYERVMPGPNYIDSIQNFYRVYSGIDKESADAVEKFLKTIISVKDYPLTRLGNTNATEMAKVLENSYRALNISFTEEWSRFAEEAGVNLFEVVKAIRLRPTHANLMLPGIGVGGYCLTKDPLLASWSKQSIFKSSKSLAQSERGVEINDKMPISAFNFMVKSFEGEITKKNVLLLGVSYRGDVGDTRYSPVERFYKELLKEECVVHLCDPYVSYWEEQEVEVQPDFEEILMQQLDILVISCGHSLFRNNKNLIQLIEKQKNMLVFDAIGLLSEDEINRIRRTNRVCVLGRGDLK